MGSSLDIENKNEGSSDKKTVSHLESALIKEIQKILLNTNQEIGGGTSEEILTKDAFEKIQQNLIKWGFNDFYHFLGVDKNIEKKELRSACVKKIKEYQGAIGIKTDEKTKALFQLATETKKILVENEGKDRQRYNNWLSGNGSSSSSSSTSRFSRTSASDFYSSSSFESLSAEIKNELARSGVKTEELMDYFGLGKMSSGLDYTKWKEILKGKNLYERPIYAKRLKYLINNISVRKGHMKNVWEQISTAEQRARVFLGSEIKVTYREGMMVMGESCGLKELQTILDSALQNIGELEKQKKEEEIKIRLEERRIKEFEREKVRLTSYFNKYGAQIVKKDKWNNQWMAIFTSIENAVDETSLKNIEQNTIPDFLFDQAKKRIQKELGKHYDKEKDCPENDRESVFKDVQSFIGKAKNRVKKAATEEIDNVLDELNKMENLSISLNRDFVEEIWGAENLEQVDNLYELASTEIKKEVINFLQVKIVESEISQGELDEYNQKVVYKGIDDINNPWINLKLTEISNEAIKILTEIYHNRNNGNNNNIDPKENNNNKQNIIYSMTKKKELKIKIKGTLNIDKAKAKSENFIFPKTPATPGIPTSPRNFQKKKAKEFENQVNTFLQRFITELDDRIIFFNLRDGGKDYYRELGFTEGFSGMLNWLSTQSRKDLNLFQTLVREVAVELYNKANEEARKSNKPEEEVPAILLNHIDIEELRKELAEAKATSGTGTSEASDSTWKDNFTEIILGEDVSSVKDSENEKVNQLREIAASLRKAINNLKLLDIDLENPQVLGKATQTDEIKFSWEKDWEIYSDVISTLDWKDIKENWNDQIINDDDSEPREIKGYQSWLADHTLKDLLSIASQWENKVELDKVWPEVVNLSGISDGFNTDNIQEVMKEIKRRAPVLKQTRDRLKNELGIDIYVVAREDEKNWEAKIDNLIEVKKWFEKIFGVNINSDDWQGQVVGLLGQDDKKEENTPVIEKVFTLKKAYFNTNLNLLDLISDWRKKGEDSKKLDDLLKGFGYQAPAKTSDEVNPDFQKLPHPFDKNKTTYFSDFIKMKLGDKTFNDTNLTLADFIAERNDYGSLISHLGYSPITFDNTNLEWIKSNVKDRAKGQKSLVGIIDEADKYQTIINEKKNKDILTEDGNFDQTKLVDLREKAKEANKKTVILEWKGQGLEDGTMPYGEFEIINDEEVVLDIGHYSKPGVNFKTFRKGENVRFYSTFFVDSSWEKGGFFKLTYPSGILLADQTYNIVQSAEGGHEFESLFSSKKTLILEKTIEDDLKEAKAYVLDNLNRLKGILISNKGLSEEAEKIKKDTIPKNGDWKTKLDPNNNTLATPKQLIEYFDIVNKAIRNVENQLDLSYAKTAVEWPYDLLEKIFNTNDTDLSKEISRLHPDILADGFNWKNGIKNKTNIDGLRDFSLYSSDAICDLAKKRALNDLTKLKGNLKDEEVNAAVNKVKRDTIPEGESWQNKLQPTGEVVNLKVLDDYFFLVRDAIIELKVEAMETERDDWKARVKEVIGEAKETVLKYQKDLTTAKAEALTALQNQQGDVDDANINNQIRVDDANNGTNHWAAQNNWNDKLQADDATFTNSQELNTYVRAVSEAIETLKGQEKEIELNEAKKNILTGLENLQDATITDADINRGISRNSNENITGTDNWKNVFSSTDDRINDYKTLGGWTSLITSVINQAKINQDLKSAKQKALDDLKKLKENLNDGDINDAAEKIQADILPAGGSWKTKLKDTNNEIKSTEELTRYVHVITDAISKVKGTTDIKNAKIHAANRLGIFKGTLNDNDITVAANEIEPNSTSRAIWTQKLQANDSIITNAEQLSHYVKIITRAINKLNTDHDLKQAKVQTRVALQNLIQTSGLTDDQINAKIVEFSPGIPAGNTNWHDKLKENDTTLTDAKALAKHVTLLTRSITASKGADATTELNQVKGERNNLEGQVKLVRSELSIGTDVTDVVNNKLTAADLADYKTAKTNLTTRKNEIKHAIDNNTIPNNWQNTSRNVYDELRKMVNGNPAGTLPANWENKLVKKADLDTEKAKITTLKNDLGVIKNDNSIDTVRVNQIKDNEAELTRINNDIIAKIKTKTNLKTLIKLNANNKNEIDDVRLNEIETILSTPANTSAADVAKYKAKLQGLGIAAGQEKPDDSWENELINKKPLTQAGYSDFNVMLADLNSLKTEKSDFQNKLSQQQEHCRKEKEAFQAQIEQKEQDLLKFMVEQLRLNLTGDKYERQQVLAEIQKLIVNPDTNQETTLANLRQKITEQEKEIKKLREQNKENIPTPELKQQAEKVLKELGLKNSYQTQIDKITSLSELTDFYQQAAKNEIGKVKGEKDQMRNWNIALWLLFVGNLLITTFVIMKVKGGKALGKKGK